MPKNSKYVALRHNSGTLFESLDDLMASEDAWNDEILEVDTGLVYNRDNREEFLADHHELDDVDYQVIIIAHRNSSRNPFKSKSTEHVLATFDNRDDAQNYLDQNLPGIQEAYVDTVYKTHRRELTVNTSGYEAHTFAYELLKNSGFSMIYGMPLTVRDGSFPAVTIGRNSITGYHEPSVDKVADLLNNNTDLANITEEDDDDV